MTWRIALLLCLSLTLATTSDTTSSSSDDSAIPEIEIPQGKIRPTIMKSAFDGHTIYAFRGIPYGRVKRRFAPAEPAGPWEGVLEADSDGPECLQWDEAQERVIGQEDCLYLNVYTLGLPPKNPTAPLVFLHGGDWLAGSGSSRWYGPRYWLDHDVMLVTVNYRLGAFGFASTGDTEAPGNLGLHDQVLALQWINDNIQFFGGIAFLTTVMGEGTGGASVHLLQLTQRAKNLFERAISQSGTAFCPWAMVPETFNNTALLAERLACPLDHSSRMMECLRGVDGEEIVRATEHMIRRKMAMNAPFGPVVDFYSPDAFLPKSPSELMAEVNFRHSPWIVGVNAHEGADMAYAWLSDPERLRQLDSQFTEILPELLSLSRSAGDPGATSERIRKHYFGSRSIDDSSASQLVDMLTDRLFLSCTEKAAYWHAFYSTHKVFVYQWNLKGRLGYRDLQHAHKTGEEVPHWHPGRRHSVNSNGDHNLGVSQKDELLLMFSNELAPLYDAKDPMVQEIRSILNMWVTFVKTGDPTPDFLGEDSDYSPWEEVWEHYYPFNPFYLLIDRDWQAVEKLPNTPGIEFWESLSLDENVFKRKLVPVRDEL